MSLDITGTIKKPFAEMSEGEAYSLYTWAGHVLNRAKDEPYYAELLKSLDISSFSREAKAIFYCAVLDIPWSLDFLSKEDMKLLEESVPLEKPILVKEKRVHPERFAALGVFL